MAGLLERLGMSPSPPPKPTGLGGFSLPWRGRGDVGKGKKSPKTPLLGKFKGLKTGLIEKLKDQASAAITGGVSGVLVLLTIYKVVSSRESVLAESRKEEQRVMMERKERLAVMRRSLAGPLRSAARDLNTRLREILQPSPPTGDARNNYFASHYLEDPEESINTTLYRLCRYVFWVEQLQRGIRSDGDLAMDDAWQIAVDVRLERVRQALASSDPLVDATKPRERLYDVIDAAVARDSAKKTTAKREAVASDRVAERADVNKAKDTQSASETKTDTKTSPSFKATARVLGAAAGILAARSLSPDASGDVSKKATVRLNPTSSSVRAFDLTESPDEPGLRVGRFPLRLFRDTQTAIAEVFGEEMRKQTPRGSNRQHAGLNDAPPNASVTRTTDAAGGGEMLYTAFVIKLEYALGKGSGANEPWARWMVPLHLQYHRYASLQARRQKQLTPAQGREVLAARVRLNRVSKSLDQLLGVLRRRLDDPWFLHSMKRLKKEAMANSGGDAFSFADAVKRAARQDAIAETNAAAIDGKGSSGATKKRVVAKNGVFAQFRTARFLNRQRMARVEALERWSLIRESIPEVRAMGSAWWDRELPKVPGHTFFGFHFKEDSAKAAQVALAGGKTLRRLAFRVVHVVLDAAAERPVRALALIAGTALAGIAKDREKRGLAFLKLPEKLRKRSTHPTLPGGEPAVWEEQQQRTWKQTPFQVWMAAKTKGFTEFQTQPPAPAPPVRRKIPSKKLVTPKPPPREEGDASFSPPPRRAVQPVPPRQPPVGRAPPMPPPPTPVPSAVPASHKKAHPSAVPSSHKKTHAPPPPGRETPPSAASTPKPHAKAHTPPPPVKEAPPSVSASTPKSTQAPAPKSAPKSAVADAPVDAPAAAALVAAPAAAPVAAPDASPVAAPKSASKSAPSPAAPKTSAPAVPAPAAPAAKSGEHPPPKTE